MLGTIQARLSQPMVNVLSSFQLPLERMYRWFIRWVHGAQLIRFKWSWLEGLSVPLTLYLGSPKTHGFVCGR